MTVAPVLHATSAGTAGRRVVFLHGLFGQGRNFGGIARALEPRWRSLLVDLPHHGQSPWTGSVAYEDMADAVAATVRATAEPGETCIDVVGHSMGGKVAMILALRHPGLVRRLVVVDIAPGEGAGTDEFEHLLDSLAGLDLERVETRTDADAALTDPIPNPAVRGFLLQNLRRGPDGDWRWRADLDLLRAELATIGDFPDVGDATFPGRVLWIAGENSPYVTTEHVPAMRALFPQVRRLTIKGVGHWVHSERPDVFAEALRVFLGAPGDPDRRRQLGGDADLCHDGPMTTPDIQIRPVDAADAGELLTVRRAAFVSEAQIYGDPNIPPLTQTLEELRADLADPDVVTLGAWRGPRLVGSVRVGQEETRATLGRFAVVPDLHGQGIGTALLEAVPEHLGPDTTEVWVFTGRDSLHNLAMYTKQGYEHQHDRTAGTLTYAYLRRMLGDGVPVDEIEEPGAEGGAGADVGAGAGADADPEA